MTTGTIRTGSSMRDLYSSAPRSSHISCYVVFTFRRLTALHTSWTAATPRTNAAPISAVNRLIRTGKYMVSLLMLSRLAAMCAVTCARGARETMRCLSAPTISAHRGDQGSRNTESPVWRQRPRRRWIESDRTLTTSILEPARFASAIHIRREYT